MVLYTGRQNAMAMAKADKPAAPSSMDTSSPTPHMSRKRTKSESALTEVSAEKATPSR